MADGTQLEDWILKPSDPAYKTLQAKRKSNLARWFTCKSEPAEP